MRALAPRLWRWRRTAAAASIATVAMVSRANAQDTRTIFLHGLASTGSTWASVSDSLSNKFRISVARPSIGYMTILSGITNRGGFASVSSMAAELQNYLNASPPYAVVAHSAGGLVARERILLTANAQQPLQINRLLTVATPHNGASLAKAVLGGASLRPLDQQFAIMNDMVPWYGVTGEDVSPFYRTLWGPALQQFAASRSGISVDLRWFIPVLAPITSDIGPQSPLLLNLNAASNMVHEGGTDRVSVIGVTTNYALFAKALLPILETGQSPASIRADASLFEKYRNDIAMAFYTAAFIVSLRDFLYYRANGLPPCITQAIQLFKYDSCIDHASLIVTLLGAGYVLDNLNGKWRGWVGSRGDNTSDAILSDSSQFYPGLPIARRLTLSDAWHGLETRESGAIIASVLSNYWSIPARVQPLSVYIGQSGHNYTAYASGGKPPYSYLWEWCALNCDGGGGPAAPIARAPVRPNTVTRGWSVLSTQQTVYWDYVHPVTLRLTVTDAAGTQAVTTYYIP